MGKKHRQMRNVLEQEVQARAKLVKQSMCSAAFLTNALKYVGMVLIYFTFSISLTFYNKAFIHYLNFPLSLTMTHYVIKFFLASLVRLLMECRSKKPRVMLSWKTYLVKIAPPGICSSIDIGLSNWSFEFITISLYTMTKTTVIIFILAFSLLFRLEKPRCSLVLIVLLIASGLFLFTYKSTQFHMTGFILCLVASFLSGLRWTLSQMVLQKSELGLTNPVDMMYHIQPWMMVAMLPLSAPFEGVHLATSRHTFGYLDPSMAGTTALLVLAGAGLAFFLELSEYLLLVHTSSLTMSVSGIFKEVWVLLLAWKINGDQMNFMNAIGLAMCLSGILVHVIFKAIYRHEEALEPKRINGDVMELLTRDGDANDEDDIDIFNIQRDR